MATANVELCLVARDDKGSGAIYGRCIRSQALTVSGSTATITTAVTADEIALGPLVWRVSTDTACYAAAGAAPNPAATAETAATEARKLVQAGSDLPIQVARGHKVAVIAL